MDTAQLWLTIAMLSVGAALALGALYVCAVRVRDETELHDLVVQAHTLRLKQMRRLAMLSDDDEMDVEIVDEPAPAAAPPAPARRAA